MFHRRRQGAPTLARPRSQACSAAQVEEAAFLYWCEQLGEAPSPHRKKWEFCYILQAAAAGGAMAPGRRALAFGVGREPLPAMFAARGVAVTATDLAADRPEAAHWTGVGQHAGRDVDMNARGICPPARFAALVTHRDVDMNAIPDDLRDYDVCWSSCALEHLGSLEAGLAFVEASLRTLRPGGLAIHTTELNCSPGNDTVERGETVLYRPRHLKALARRLRRRGHAIDLDLTLGEQPADLHVDVPPYSQDVHLRLALAGYVSTSYGLVVRKAL